MRTHHPAIRAVLREYTDGLTVTQLVRRLAITPDSIRNSLSSMPDAYIDRWEGPHNGQYAAVWCVVAVPENCPRPTTRTWRARQYGGSEDPSEFSRPPCNI